MSDTVNTDQATGSGASEPLASQAVPEVASRPAARRGNPTLERFGLPLLLLLVVVVFSVLRPGTFPTSANFQTVATSQAVLGVGAFALIVPLTTGRFDVSIGANLAVTSIATAAAMSKFNAPLGVAILIGLAIGALIGLVNGIMVAYLGVNAFIGTIGTSTVLDGLITWYTEGVPISSGISPNLTQLSLDNPGGIPVLLILMLVIAFLTWFVLTQTPLGRHFTAVGVNQNSAQLTGLPIRRLVLISFVGGGLLAAVGGVLQLAAQGNANPQTGGLGFILPAFSAAFLGSTTWRPGKFNVPGTIIALFFVGALVSGLALLGIKPWVTDVVDGAVLIVAIALSAQFKRRYTGTLDVGH